MYSSMYVIFVCIKLQISSGPGWINPDSGFKWAECPLLGSISYWIQDFSLILSNTSSLSAGIQPVGEWASWRQSAPSNCLKQCCDIVNWTHNNKLQWNFIRNSCTFLQENVLEQAVWKMAAICIGLNVLTYSISQEICTRFCCALLCCGYAIVHNEFTWSIYPYSSRLLCWHWGNRQIATVPVK